MENDEKKPGGTEEPATEKPTTDTTATATATEEPVAAAPEPAEVAPEPAEAAPEPAPEPAEAAPEEPAEAAPEEPAEAAPEAAEAAPEEPAEPAPEPAKAQEEIDPNAPVMTIRALLEAGVHFGHQTTRWNPKMRPYIYGARNGIHIVDLQQTLPLFMRAYNFVLGTVANGHSVLFVGTKKQAQDVIREEASRCSMFFVTNRWLGGTLTNWRTVRASIDKLREIEAMAEDGTFDKLTKKEVLSYQRHKAKLERNLGGIKNMGQLPGAVFVIDPRKERIAVAEANKLEIPVVAVTDTNCDPDKVDHVIPGNDDAIRAIRLFAAKVADACIVGRRYGQERAAAASKDLERQEADAVPEPIRVTSGGDGPKVEVVSRRSAPRPKPEAAATPERND